jgi:hypothetical protein
MMLVGRIQGSVVRLYASYVSRFSFSFEQHPVRQPLSETIGTIVQLELVVIPGLCLKYC